MMATEVRVYAVTVPAGTLASAPVTSDLSFPPRIVREIRVRIPSGPRGQVGFRIATSGQQVIPWNPGSWLVTDGEVIHWPLSGQHDTGSWQLVAYNTGAYPHTVGVEFDLDVIGAAASTSAVLAPLAIVPATAAAARTSAVGSATTDEVAIGY